MASLKHAQGKLLKSGFLPQHQDEFCECWISTRGSGTISFFKRGEHVESFKVHGSQPDRPEFDEFNSHYTQNLSHAIRMCRVSL